jgi:hypothetical protein
LLELAGQAYSSRSDCKRQDNKRKDKASQPKTDLHEKQHRLESAPLACQAYRRWLQDKQESKWQPFAVIRGQLQKDNELEQEAQGLDRG